MAIGILAPIATPTVTPTEVLGTPAGAGSTPASANAGAANQSNQAPAQPHLPATGAGDERADSSWPLALLGLAAIALSLLLRGRQTGSDTKYGCILML